MDFEFRTFKIRRDKECPVCGDNPTITKPIDYEQFCGVPALDPKSLEETAREVQSYKSPQAPGSAGGQLDLDEKGLPRDYKFKPDWEVTPREVKSLLDRGENFIFVDCRLPNEHQITHIDGTKLIPLQQIGSRMSELSPHKDDKIVVHCRSGARSLQFTQMLRQNGFKDVKSMAGGILLWNKDINPGGPQY
jgi:adenylyltransferase/sulfurtransferase